jgi:hypothetical protein
MVIKVRIYIDEALQLFPYSVIFVLGPVGTSVAGLRLPTDDRILGASAELSSEFPFNGDPNSGNTIGISQSLSFLSID